MSKFFLGQRVKVINRHLGIHQGITGTILCFHTDSRGTPGVEFEDWYGGHDLYMREPYPVRKCKDKQGWYVEPDWLIAFNVDRTIIVPCLCHGGCVLCDYTGQITFYSEEKNPIRDRRFKLCTTTKV